jgi:hypothetical protein
LVIGRLDSFQGLWYNNPVSDYLSSCAVLSKMSN